MDKVLHLQSDKSIRQEASEWVVIFNGDEPPTREDIQAMQAWVKRSPAHLAELERAEARWKDTNQLAELAVPLCARCEAPGSKTAGWHRLSWFSLRRPASWGAFASLAITTVLLLSVYLPNSVVENGVYGTAVGELRLLDLEDGSQVQLDTASQAKIEFDEKTRRIYLHQGKAHFEVAKNAQRPFEVYVGGGLVRAVGTAFSVYLSGDDIEVLVDEGRVDLARVHSQPSDTASDSTVAQGSEASPPLPAPEEQVFRSLTRGQGVLFNQLKEEFKVLADKELAREQSWREGALIFAGEPLEQVVLEVSRYTSARIEITDPQLSQLEVGGRFNIGDIEALFNVLEAAFDVQVVHVAKNHYQLHALSQ